MQRDREQSKIQNRSDSDNSDNSNIVDAANRGWWKGWKEERKFFLFSAFCFLFPIFLCSCASFIGSKKDLVPTEEEIDKLLKDQDTGHKKGGGLLTEDYNYKELLRQEYKPRYYAQKDPDKALLMSAAFPGLGQSYLENYKKGMSFLASEMILFAATAYNFNRAHYYNSMSKNFFSFYDKFNGFYLSSQQGEAWSKKHLIIGSLCMISWGGIHLWNVLDAKSSAEVFKSKRSLSIYLEASPSKASIKIGSRRQ